MKTNASFKALVAEETKNGNFKQTILERTLSDLPDNDILIRVYFSSLNYKDALSATGHRGITDRYPHTPGIDAAGIVNESNSDLFKPGDPVLVHGYDLGMNTPGGFGQYIRVPEEWVLALPNGLSLRESMIYGTAGFTAALAVYKLKQAGLSPHAENGILVTGATGGVGSFGVALFNRENYRVTAATGKSQKFSYLRNLGAHEIIDRNQINDQSERLLLSRRWSGAIDTVGGNMLSTVIRSLSLEGKAACCGNVAGHELPLNIYPFILRGVTLIGIDSRNCRMSVRKEIWERLGKEWKLDQLQMIAEEYPLKELDKAIETILEGAVTGRIVINLQD